MWLGLALRITMVSASIGFRFGKKLRHKVQERHLVNHNRSKCQTNSGLFSSASPCGNANLLCIRVTSSYHKLWWGRHNPGDCPQIQICWEVRISISKKCQIISPSLCSCQAPGSNFMFKLLFNPMRLPPPHPVVFRGCIWTILTTHAAEKC